ncbi:hypothetical protein JTE90_012277 [Oedothorax gibbosus]|uniref:Single-stranded DNA-binding protein, mitochondrial n=1 Tax=Oedothorax gibbosus TaxID=931172 RepID=A0AAV6VJY7_9ARAC|nr:hypothetical protein JTE90_012277 [Oedothorax gibbosus]
MNNIPHLLTSFLGKPFLLKCASNSSQIRHFCNKSPRVILEKSVNKVTLMGRVGIDPQLRGSESKPCVIFTLATNTNYKYESGEIQQKTDWHKVTVFKPYLRDIVLDNLKKGSRVYVDGRILYGEFTDSNGKLHSSTSIVANEIIFLGAKRNETEIADEDIAATT